MLDTLKRMTILPWYINGYVIFIWAGMLWPAERFLYYAIAYNSWVIFITGGLFVYGIYWLTARFLEIAYDMELEKRERKQFNRNRFNRTYRSKS